MQQHKGFGKILPITVLALLLIVVAISFYFYSLYNSESGGIASDVDSPKQSSTDEQTEPIINEVLADIDHQVVDSVGDDCNYGDRSCRQSTIVSLDLPVKDDFSQLINNLSDNGWTRSNSEPIDIDTAEVWQSFDENNYGVFSLLANSNRNKVASTKSGYELRLFAFSKTEVQTNEQPFYIMRSEVYMPDNFDFENIFENQEQNTYFLNVGLSK